MGDGVSLCGGRMGQAARRTRASNAALRVRRLLRDLRLSVARAARARARWNPILPLPPAERCRALRDRVRAHQSADRVRSERSTADEPAARSGRRMAAPHETDMARRRGLIITLVAGALAVAVLA